MTKSQLSPIASFASLIFALTLSACGSPESEEQSPPVKGLRVFEVSQSASTETRRYPTLIEPAAESGLSFEINGQLGEVTLKEGQTVNAGDLLMQLDPTSLNLELQEARAAREQAETSLNNAQSDFDRKQELLETGAVTRTAYDNAKTALANNESQRVQATRRYELANERLSKATLSAPFDGIITNVEADSFTNVSAGKSVVTLYSQNALEVRFNVPANIVNQIKVGDQTVIAVSDLPGVQLRGRIQEISARASLVSAFPVVVALQETSEGLKAGMAAEISLRFALPGGVDGFLVPLSAINTPDMPKRSTSAKTRTGKGSLASVFVFDAASSTVKAAPVRIVGVRENMVIIKSGLKAGDIIASAGVSYLHEGQKVRPLVHNHQTPFPLK